MPPTRTPGHPVPHAAHEARRNAARKDRFVPEKGQRISKINWWHEQISDWMLLYPDKNLSDCADYFGVTQSWLSSVRNSDLFKEFHRLRMEQHRAEVSGTVIERAEGVAKLSLEVLHERIEKERQDIGLGIVKDTAAMALQALGYSSRSGNGPASDVNVNVNVVSSDVLERARNKMKLINGGEEDTSDDTGNSSEGAEALPAPV